MIAVAACAAAVLTAAAITVAAWRPRIPVTRPDGPESLPHEVEAELRERGWL